MRVLFFNPEQASSEGLKTMKRLGLSEEPLLESAFYADLTAKSLSAVSKMKKGGGLLPGKVQSNSSLFRRKLARNILHKVQPVFKGGAHCQRAGPYVRPEELRLGQQTIGSHLNYRMLSLVPIESMAINIDNSDSYTQSFSHSLFSRYS